MMHSQSQKSLTKQAAHLEEQHRLVLNDLQNNSNQALEEVQKKLQIAVTNAKKANEEAEAVLEEKKTQLTVVKQQKNADAKAHLASFKSQAEKFENVSFTFFQELVLYNSFCLIKFVFIYYFNILPKATSGTGRKV